METKIIALQRWARGHLCRRQLSSLRDRMTLRIVLDLLHRYKQQCVIIDQLNEEFQNKKIRKPNFPSEISENVVKFILGSHYGIMPSWDTPTGDLQQGCLRIEVKAFSSTGPTTFGPTEAWDRIYFLDATRFQQDIFRLYECRLSHRHPLWQSLKINRSETFHDHCRQGRRPRLRFEEIRSQLGSERCPLIFEGVVNESTMNQK